MTKTRAAISIRFDLWHANQVCLDEPRLESALLAAADRLNIDLLVTDYNPLADHHTSGEDFDVRTFAMDCIWADPEVREVIDQTVLGVEDLEAIMREDDEDSRDGVDYSAILTPDDLNMSPALQERLLERIAQGLQ